MAYWLLDFTVGLLHFLEKPTLWNEARFGNWTTRDSYQKVFSTLLRVTRE
jgi:hypothetical protein